MQKVAIDENISEIFFCMQFVATTTVSCLHLQNDQKNNAFTKYS